MEVKNAVFVVSNSDYRKCPDTGKPEYAFIGRSNVGKSSLINMLTRNKGLAKTSVRPGKTQLINHFLINNEWYLVDLPGYGYARTSKTSRAAWQKMITEYLTGREPLVNTFVLIDSRIPPQKIDLEFISFLGRNGVPLAVVFTKVDKQNQSETARNVNTFKQALLEEWEELPTMFLTSSVSGTGRDKVLGFIEQCNALVNENKTR
ncbi:MAG: YihA family ribosome biogenesis GTP-binding protein [Bacteroidales bacterium]|jgi:GTP-binding protein|nr:YihA family ribosome biogenesis GTP-binding protein [Bacteroidales bacterium]